MNRKIVKIILLGPPGAGKGTQAEHLRREYGIPHISTGDIIRKEIKNKTEFGLRVEELTDKGKFVPDEEIIAVVDKRLKEDDCKNGFILDGYPRTIEQAKHLAIVNGIDAAINITLDDELIVKRMSSRLTCLHCNKVYGEAKPPKVEGVCDKCGSKLERRKDQEPEVVKKRIKVYHELTEPLIGFYKEKGILHNLDGSKTIAEVYEEIKQILAK